MKAINGLVILMIFFTTVAKSEVYKWVDENGQVHYTDKPQPKIKNKEVLELKADIGPRETAKAKA